MLERALELVFPIINNIFQGNLDDSPKIFFHNSLLILIFITALIKLFARQKNDNSTNNDIDDRSEDVISYREKEYMVIARSLRWKYLPVFWLLRLTFWMAGPYFFAVYASKTINGEPASIRVISYIFLMGYASIALLGPATGQFSDKHGRKKATLLSILMCTISSYSTVSNKLFILFIGRGIGGVGTSLLNNAPESWLAAEATKQIKDGSGSGNDSGFFLRETFGMAYAGDSLVAILAGQLAYFAASSSLPYGPTGPFILSPLFLAMGSVLIVIYWKENISSKEVPCRDNGSKTRRSIELWRNAKRKLHASHVFQHSHSPIVVGSDRRDHLLRRKSLLQVVKDEPSAIVKAWNVIKSDRNVLMVGIVQCLFELSMQIFIMSWSPVLKNVMMKHYNYGDGVDRTPYGTIFSCFMSCCLIGSTIFSQITLRLKTISTEQILMWMLVVAVICMGCTTTLLLMNKTTTTSNNYDNRDSDDRHHFVMISTLFFVYEICCGIYFPSIGTLRAKYVPNDHRSLIMTLFGVPLNVFIVTVFLFIDKLKHHGAMFIATISLLLAALCMVLNIATTIGCGDTINERAFNNQRSRQEKKSLAQEEPRGKIKEN